MNRAIYLGAIVVAVFMLMGWFYFGYLQQSSITAAPVKNVQEAQNAVISMSYSIDNISSALQSIDQQLG